MEYFFYNFSAFHHDLYVEIVIEYSTFYHDFVLSVTISLLSVTISRNSITIYQPQNFPEGFCFGNPRSRSTMAPKNPKSYLENRKSYEFLNAIFDFRQWSPFPINVVLFQSEKDYIGESRKSHLEIGSSYGSRDSRALLSREP